MRRIRRSGRHIGHLAGRRAAGLVGAGLAVALVATACSNPPGTSAANNTNTGSGALAGQLAAASKTTASVHTFHTSVTVTGTTGGTSTTYLTGQASVDLQARKGTATLQVPAIDGTSGSSGSSTVTVVADGTTVYLQVPGLASVTGGKSWLSLPERTGTASTGLSLTDTALGNPSDLLRLRAAHASSVTEVGTPTLGGAATTEYKAVISVAEIEAQAASHHRRRLAAAARKVVSALGVTSVPVTVWVGTDGYLRQVQLTLDLSHAQPGPVLGSLLPSGPLPVVTETVAFSAYGAPVTVTAPPASDALRGASALRSLVRTFLGGIGSGSGSGGGAPATGGASGTASA